MTHAEKLKCIAARLNDENGKGGKTRLAKLLDWNYSTLWRKLNEESATTKSDIEAARSLADKATGKSSGAA